MKRLTSNAFVQSTLMLALFTFMAVAFSSCKDNNDGDMSEPTTGMLNVSDQTLSQNMITVSSINMSAAGWVVVHADNNGGPQVPGIISEPVYLEAGENDNVQIPFAKGVKVTDGEKVWVMLHEDTRVKETYEFDGSDNSADMPITDADGNIVMTQITLMAPSIMAEDQVISNNEVVIKNVNAAVDGWVVVHNDDGTGNITLPGIIGKTFVKAGSHDNVVVTLDSTVNITPGQKLFPMLHVDSPANMEYDFPDNGDNPEVFSLNSEGKGSIILTSINVKAPTGSLTVSDQAISGNMVMVPSITMDAAGWVVIHKDNGSGPVVPAIVSEPVHLDKGTNTDVMIPIAEGTSLSQGENLWVMLHHDDGRIGTYEFDGANGFDNPIVEGGAPVMTKIAVTGASITAADQAVSNNQITIASVTLVKDGWLVVHNDDGTGNITLPGIIGKKYLTAGTHTNVVIDLDNTNTYTAGQKLFPMVHIDSPANQTYDFPDNGDNPEVYGYNGTDANIVLTSLTVQ